MICRINVSNYKKTKHFIYFLTENKLIFVRYIMRATPKAPGCSRIFNLIRLLVAILKDLTLKKKDMKQLNIQERKLNLIEQLIILKDEEVIKQVEELINSLLKRPPLKRLTIKELKNRAKISEKNIEKGEVYSQEDVERMSQNW